MTDVNEIISSPFVRVKLVAFVHFIFICNAMFGTGLVGAYLFYNILFILAMFWSIHCKESIESIQTALLIDALSIVFDLICISIFFNYMNGWTITFSILNLILRPISAYLLHKEFTERGGIIPTGGQIFPIHTNNQQQQRTYQDMDRPNQPIPTNNSSPTQQNVSSIY
ncbi:AGTRAP family protein [Megaselia abdita]